MISITNTRTQLRLVFLAAVSIFLLDFQGIGLFREATAAQEVSQDQDDQAHWGYKASNGPSRWGEMNPEWVLCAKGKKQSPINLTGPTREIVDVMRLNFPAANLTVVHQAHVVDVIDNGHTIQVNYDKGETFQIGNESYELRQYHFHSPSEHTVNGRHYPMEMHLVHESKAAKLAVIGVLIEEGQHNKAFDAVWSNLPKTVGQEVHLEDVQVDIDEMLPKNNSTYRYSGSLTTPPCSEGVSWFVYVEPIQLSSDQIQAFREIFHGNNRPTQPLNDRTIVYDVCKLTTQD